MLKLKYLIPDKLHIKYRFLKKNGYPLNLETPKTFNEKIQWLKLNHRDPLMTTVSDKYLVREYVTKTVGAHILNPLFNTYNSVGEIILDDLPEQFVLKTNNGSGGNVICRSKQNRDFICDELATTNWNDCKHLLKTYLQTNYYWASREWQYKNICPKIICEKYLENNNKDLMDFKVFCFNGKPAFIQVIIDQFNDGKCLIYDTNWQPQTFTINLPSSTTLVPRPKILGQLLNDAAQLSRPFPFARVDFFILKTKLIFGEITLTPLSGCAEFMPNGYEDDLKVGQLLTINN